MAHQEIDDLFAALSLLERRKVLDRLADGLALVSQAVVSDGGVTDSESVSESAANPPLQDHLSDLAGTQLIDWDRAAGVVSPGPTYDRMRPLLEGSTEDTDPITLDSDPDQVPASDRLADLQRRNEHLETFTRLVAHDLRNPLSTLEANLELAIHRHDDLEELANARAALDNALSVVDDVVRYREVASRIDPASVVLPSVAESAWTSVDTAGASLRVEDDQTSAWADREHLATLLSVLFDNAIVHNQVGKRDGTEATGDSLSDDGDDLVVRVGQLPDQDGFFVEDNGRGIPESDRDCILEAGVTTTGDTGLGLTIVREIAAGHDWTINVTESSSGGARFEIRGVQAPPRDAARSSVQKLGR